MRIPSLVLAVLAAAGISRAATTIALNWFPEAEHAGFFAAQAANLYADAGVEVKLLPGGPGAPVLQQVATGRVDFGVSNADEVLIARSQGVPVVAVLAPIQTSPRVIMVHQGSGIRKLSDLRNLTLAIEPQAPFANFLKRKLPLEGVRFVPYGGSVAPFVADSTFAQQAYGISEPFVAQQKGAKPVNLLVSDLGYNPYTSVLVVSEKTLKERPDLVKKVVRASQQGWGRYLQHPEAANAAIRAVNSQVDLPVLQFGHQELLKLCRNADTDSLGLGIMTAARWDDLAAQLVEMGVIPKGKVDPSKAWSRAFLPR
ncbi:MAG: ABC transporter substrate-binding protein [Fibrobacteria bacterium]|nr:ABC transporter substrate-binding protein [Fibrobacteria bacterium]